VINFKDEQPTHLMMPEALGIPQVLADQADPADSGLDRGYGRLRTLLIGLDVIGAFVAWLVVLTVAGGHAWGVRFEGAIVAATVLTLFEVALLAVHRLYLARVCAVRTVEVARLASSSVACGLAAVWLKQTAHVGPPPSVVAVGVASSFMIVMCLRVGYSSWLRTRKARGLFCRRVCVVGVNEEAEALVHMLHAQPELGYRVVGVVGESEDWDRRMPEVPVIGPGVDVAVAVREAGASGVVIAASSVGPLELDGLVRQFVSRGVHVQISTGLARIGYRRMRVSPLAHQVMFYVERPKLSWWQSALKRTIDLVLATVGLLVAAPVLAVAAIAIKLDDRGPIIYRQERIGRDGRPFGLFKFRSMVPNASAQLAALVGKNERNGPLFKLAHDPRVTRVGRILRATSIDELPQLFNVVRGEMSLVGPRPALASEVAQFDVELLERSSVPPGITGLWQVEARDNPSFHTYRRLDLFYVDNWSVAMDLTILVATLGVVVKQGLRSLRRGTDVMVASGPSNSPGSPTPRLTPLQPVPARD
jgi:exopolysaccharide biosynthesis polyprenyl glycosylphosphotransferase